MQIFEVFFSLLKKIFKLEFTHLEVGDEQIHDGSSARSPRIEVVDLMDDSLLLPLDLRLGRLWWVDQTSANRHHEVFVCAWHDHVDCPFFAGLNYVTGDFGALKAISWIYKMIYFVLFA